MNPANAATPVAAGSPNTAAADEGPWGVTTVAVKPNKPRGSNKLDYLDGLRGYAALTVVIDHFILFFMPSYYASVGWAGLAALAPSFYNGAYRLPSSKAESLVFPFMDGTFSVALFFVLSGRVLVARSVIHTCDQRDDLIRTGSPSDCSIGRLTFAVHPYIHHLNSYLGKDKPPTTAIASATIRRLFRLGIPPLFMVLISWFMDQHEAFKNNARAAAVTRSPFGSTDVHFAMTDSTNTFKDVFLFLVALFTDNDKAVTSPLTVSFRQQYTYMTSVLWTLRLEFRASMIVFFVAVVLKAVPPKSRWLIYGALIWWFHMVCTVGAAFDVAVDYSLID
jgi:peptidoglycan/LPS O-acetylase OafA/YrhL